MSTPSARLDIKIDVWKYIWDMMIGLGAVLEEKLAHPDPTCSLGPMFFGR